MCSEHSVSTFISLLQTEATSLAENEIFRRYYSRLVNRVVHRLDRRRRGPADEEDVALSAMDSFFRGIYQGRFPELRNRDDLWNLLLTISYRKAIKHCVRETRRKRGGGLVRNESTLKGKSENEMGLDELAEDPSDDDVARIAEELTEGLEPTLRKIAYAKLQGYTDREVAEQLGVAERTIIRKRQCIQAIWQDGLAE